MKAEKNILIAFILNLTFSIFEFIGGLLTNSISIISDSIHDLGDSISIGLSFILERISKKSPDDKYTYGYIRYSILGSLITTIILIIGSLLIFYNAIKRIINPIIINYNGMLLFAIIGVIINFLAAYYTSHGDSLNQKSVNLHMLEDVLGWSIVLIGAIIMKITNISILDPILSILLSIFILINAFKNLKDIIDLFLEKTPSGVNINEIKEDLLKIKNVYDIHHVHIWSMDGFNNYATMHIVLTKEEKEIKSKIRKELEKYNIKHVTIEIENKDDICLDTCCEIIHKTNKHNHK